jgi:phenylacetic acid degradation protein/carnitine operon protein CaiE
MLYEFKGWRPVVDPSAFVHPQAAVTGNVIIGKNVYIGPGAAIRGDWGKIIIEDGCNVQESCTIHMFPGVTVRLMAGSHIGHGAIVHGAAIGRNCLIGMNSVIMDNAVVGDESIVGALSFVKEGMIIPARSVVVGNPAKVVKEVSEDMLKWKTEGTAIYQALPREMKESWAECGAMGQRELRGDDQYSGEDESGPAYRPWKEASKQASYKAEEGPMPEVHEPARRYGYEEARFSIEEYLDMEKYANVKHEYYNGAVFAMSGAKADHNLISINLIFALKLKLSGSTCEVFNSDQRIFIEERELFTYPDVSLVCGEPIYRKDDYWNLTNPVLIAEVLSPHTKGYDRKEKFLLYQALPGFREYLLIDSTAVLLEQHVRSADGSWHLNTFTKLSDTFEIGAIGSCMTLDDLYRGTRFPKLSV